MLTGPAFSKVVFVPVVIPGQKPESTEMQTRPKLLGDQFFFSRLCTSESPGSKLSELGNAFLGLRACAFAPLGETLSRLRFQTLL